MLLNCLSRMNKNDFNLYFTMSHHKQRIAFLDVEVYRGEGGTLLGKLYRKPTAGNAIMHATSLLHPKALIKSIPYRQYLRIRRNCTDDAFFQMEANNLWNCLLSRGYSHASLKRTFQKVSKRSRYNLLYFQTPKSNANSLRIITRFTNQQHKVKNIVENYWHMLSLDPLLGPLVPNKPLFTFRRATSVKDRVVSTEFKGDNRKDHCKYKGTFMCGTCNYCRFMLTHKKTCLAEWSDLPPKTFC